MADLLSLTTPLLIRYPDDTRHVMVEVSFGTQTVLIVESVFTKLR